MEVCTSVAREASRALAQWQNCGCRSEPRNAMESISGSKFLGFPIGESRVENGPEIAQDRTREDADQGALSEPQRLRLGPVTEAHREQDNAMPSLSSGVWAACRLSLLFRCRAEVPWRGLRRALCGHSAAAPVTDPRGPTLLKDVTVVDGLSEAIPAVKRLLEMGPERNVAWCAQMRPGQADADIIPPFSMSAYAGNDVDFGNGPHLFIHSCDGLEREKVWMLMKKYFEDNRSSKVWFDYAALGKGFTRQGIQPCGFVADLVSMAELTTEKIKPENLDVFAAAFLKPSEVATSEAVLSMDGLHAKSMPQRPWEISPEGPGLGTDSGLIARACADASLTYMVFERLREMLQSMEIHGINSTFDFQGEFSNLYEVYRYFFAPLAVQLHEMQSRGITVDRRLLESENRRSDDEKSALETQFLKWACEFSPEAALIDIGSAAQLRQLLFAPCTNIHVKTKALPSEDSFVVLKKGKKGETTPSEVGKLVGSGNEKFLLRGRGAEAKVYTKAGWPSVATSALRKAAGYPRAKKPSFGQKDHAFCFAVDDLLRAKSMKNTPAKSSSGTMIEQRIDGDSRMRLNYRIDAKKGQLMSTLKEKEALSVRKVHCASQGNMLVVGQYKDFDLSMLAHLSGCDALRKRLESGPQKHDVSTMCLFDHVKEAVHEGTCSAEGVPGMGRYSPGLRTIAEVFPQEYLQSKLLDVGMARGGSVQFVQKTTGTAAKVTKKLMQRWYAGHPGVQDWRERCVEFARVQGFLETLLGRRIATKSVEGEHWRHRDRARAAAVGYVVSGSCGEALMGAVVNLGKDETLVGLGWNVVSIYGTAVVLEGPGYAVDVVKPVVERIIREPVDFDLDVFFDVGVFSGVSMEAIEKGQSSSVDQVASSGKMRDL